MSENNQKLQTQEKIKKWLIVGISIPLILIGWITLNLITKLAFGKLVEEGEGAAPLILGIMFFLGMSIVVRIFWLKAPKRLYDTIDNFSANIASKYESLKTSFTRPKSIWKKLETPIAVTGLLLFALCSIFGFLLGKDNTVGERITGAVFLVGALVALVALIREERKNKK